MRFTPRCVILWRWRLLWQSPLLAQDSVLTRSRRVRRVMSRSPSATIIALVQDVRNLNIASGVSRIEFPMSRRRSGPKRSLSPRRARRSSSRISIMTSSRRT